MDYKVNMVPAFSVRSVNQHDRASFNKAAWSVNILQGGGSAGHALYHSLGLTFWMRSAPDSKVANFMLFSNAWSVNELSPQ